MWPTTTSPPYTHTWHIPRRTSDTLQSTAPSSFPFEICKTTRAKLGDKKHRERLQLRICFCLNSLFNELMSVPGIFQDSSEDPGEEREEKDGNSRH